MFLYIILSNSKNNENLGMSIIIKVQTMRHIKKARMIYQICQLNNIHLHIIHSNIFTFKIFEYKLEN